MFKKISVLLFSDHIDILVRGWPLVIYRALLSYHVLSSVTEKPNDLSPTGLSHDVVAVVVNWWFRLVDCFRCFSCDVRLADGWVQPQFTPLNGSLQTGRYVITTGDLTVWFRWACVILRERWQRHAVIRARINTTLVCSSSCRQDVLTSVNWCPQGARAWH